MSNDINDYYRALCRLSNNDFALVSPWYSPIRRNGSDRECHTCCLLTLEAVLVEQVDLFVLLEFSERPYFGAIKMVTRRLYSGSINNIMRAILLLIVGISIVEASKEVKTSETTRNLEKESRDSLTSLSFLPFKETTQDSIVAVKNLGSRTDDSRINDASVEQESYAATVFTDETDMLEETSAAAALMTRYRGLFTTNQKTMHVQVT